MMCGVSVYCDVSAALIAELVPVSSSEFCESVSLLIWL